MRESVSIDIITSFDNLAIVAEDAPTERRSSVLFIFLSINNFRSLLYETRTIEFTFIVYHFCVYTAMNFQFSLRSARGMLPRRNREGRAVAEGQSSSTAATLNVSPLGESDD